MTSEEIHSAITEKIENSWAAYQERMMQLPKPLLFEKAEEIAAAWLCCNELTENLSAYPDDLLEHLLCFDNPLEIMREQWVDEQCADCSEAFEHALWSLWDHGPVPEDTPQIGSITQM